MTAHALLCLRVFSGSTACIPAFCIFVPVVLLYDCFASLVVLGFPVQVRFYLGCHWRLHRSHIFSRKIHPTGELRIVHQKQTGLDQRDMVYYARPSIGYNYLVLAGENRRLRAVVDAWPKGTRAVETALD